MTAPDRVWEPTANGWASREADADDRARAAIFARWRSNQIHYQQVLKELALLDKPEADA